MDLEDNTYSDQLVIDGDIVNHLVEILTCGENQRRRNWGQTLVLIFAQPLEYIMKNIHQILSALLVVTEDKEIIVRSQLVAKIPEIFEKCTMLCSTELEYCLYDRLIDIVLTSLQDPEIMMRIPAYDCLMLLLNKNLIDKNRIARIVCPAIVAQAKLPLTDKDCGELQAIAVKVMAKLTFSIGNKLTDELFLNQFISMCSCGSYDVRRMCALCFPLFCNALGIEATEKLLPVFIKLSTDKVWQVRMAAVDALIPMAMHCTIEACETMLAPMILTIVDDKNSLVKLAARRTLGQFISLFANPCITGVALSISGSICVTNAANPNFKCLCSPEKLQNYEHYEEVFKASMRPPKSDTVAHKLAAIYETSDRRFEHLFEYETTKTISPPDAILLMDEYPRIAAPSETPWFEVAGSKNIVLNGKSYCVNDFADETTSEDDDSTFNLNRSLFDDEDSINDETIPIHDNVMNESDDKNSDAALLAACIGEDDLESENYFGLKEHHNNMEFGDHETAASPDSGCADNEVDDEQSSAKSVPNCHLWKNTPSDLQEIIKEVISFTSKKQEEKHKLMSGGGVSSSDGDKKNKRHNNDLRLSIATEQPPPPETPQIEDAPTDIDFNINLNDTEYDNEFSINLAGSDCGRRDQNDNPEQKPINDNGNDIPLSLLSEDAYTSTEDAEFNSYHYWRIEPPEMSFDLTEISNGGTLPAAPVEQQPLPPPPQPLKSEQQSQSLLSARHSMSIGDIDNDYCQRYLSGLSQPKYKTAKQSSPPIVLDGKNCTVPSALIGRYYKICTEINLNYDAAYNYPAVLLTVGKENWKLMHECLQIFCSDSNWKIRRVMAASIVQIAQIIGRDLASRDLVAVYVGFLNDVPDVKLTALRQLIDFLRIIHSSRHDEIVQNLRLCLAPNKNNWETRSNNWRLHYNVALQLPILIELYTNTDKQSCVNSLLGIAMDFLKDSANAVREVAVDAILSYVRLIRDEELRLFLWALLDYAEAPHWRTRQIFANLCYTWVANKAIEPAVFEKELLEIVLTMARDRVPNVRLFVAKSLAVLAQDSYFNEPEHSECLKRINEMLSALRTDDDVDVRTMACSNDAEKPTDLMDQCDSVDNAVDAVLTD